MVTRLHQVLFLKLEDQECKYKCHTICIALYVLLNLSNDLSRIINSCRSFFSSLACCCLLYRAKNAGSFAATGRASGGWVESVEKESCCVPVGNTLRRKDDKMTKLTLALLNLAPSGVT